MLKMDKPHFPLLIRKKNFSDWWKLYCQKILIYLNKLNIITIFLLVLTNNERKYLYRLTLYGYQMFLWYHLNILQRNIHNKTLSTNLKTGKITFTWRVYLDVIIQCYYNVFLIIKKKLWNDNIWSKLFMNRVKLYIFVSKITPVILNKT